MELNSKRIKHTTIEGITYFENELDEYIKKTRKNIAVVQKAQQSVASYWKDEKFKEAKYQIDELMEFKNELNKLEALIEWIEERKKHFAEAMEILNKVERG